MTSPGDRTGSSTAALLRTKLYVPPLRPNLVSRPRLIRRLNEGLRLGRKLTLLSAPAGFGKTTLLSEWVADCQRLKPQVRIAWVSLDKGDNDPTRFWVHFAAALQTIHPGVGQAAQAAVESPQPPPLESVLTALINEIAALPVPPSRGSRRGWALVLDDYHLIEAPPIHEALAFLLDHLPPQMHLILSSRADPPLFLSRLRGRGQLSELRTADLRFTPDEAAAFLNQAMGLGLSSQDVAALEARTEGWIVGLQMVALSMEGRRRAQAGSLSEFVKSFTGSHRYVVDYLTDEVLSQQPESVQAFLRQTAILDRLSGPLCDAVTGQGNGREMLEQLDAANLFIVPLDEERQWYRYHHLFADLLRQRLQQTQPGVVPELHRRASAWHEGNGLVTEAVRHALLGSDFDRVGQLVARRALTMIYHGELGTLLGWLEAIPHHVVRSRPWLCVAYAWVLGCAGRPGSIEPLLQGVEDAWADLDDRVERQRLAGHIAAIRAYATAQKRDLARAIDLTREALEHLPENDLMVRSFTMAVAGNLLRMSGDLVAATQAITEAIVLAQAAGANYIAVDARCDLVKIQIARGQLHQAAATCGDVLRLAGGPIGRGAWPLPIIGQASAWLSLVLREWNDLEGALHHARDGLAVCRRWGQAAYLGFAYLAVAKTLQAMGDAIGALDAVRQGEEVLAGLPPSVIALVTAWEVQTGNRGHCPDRARQEAVRDAPPSTCLGGSDPLSCLGRRQSLWVFASLVSQHTKRLALPGLGRTVDQGRLGLAGLRRPRAAGVWPQSQSTTGWPWAGLAAQCHRGFWLYSHGYQPLSIDAHHRGRTNAVRGQVCRGLYCGCVSRFADSQPHRRLALLGALPLPGQENVASDACQFGRTGLCGWINAEEALVELIIDAVSKMYKGQVWGLRAFSLKLGPGVLGLLGPNGAGKTTLMNILATVTRPAEGRVTWSGANSTRPVDIARSPNGLRAVLGYLPQDFGVYPNLNAVEFLQYLAAIKGVSGRAARRRIDELLQLVNLTDVRDRPLGSYSGGMKQRVGIAQALLNDPQLLIVDEPTAGLDPEERVRFRNLLSDLSGQRIVILSTHIVSDVEATATEIALIHKGRLLRHALPEELLQAVEGKVWTYAIPSSELTAFRQRYLVSSAVRRSDGVHVRVVGGVPPGDGACGVSPTLEDAYLHCISSANGSPVSTEVEGG